MSGYYNPNQHIPPQYYNVNPNVVPNPNIHTIPSMMASDGSIPHGMPVPESPVYGIPTGPFVPYGEPQIQQAYMDQYEDVAGTLGAGQTANSRMRRRAAPGDHVKHRRTRSGCYTCRNRRVKCDETHPICERCRKGSRECVYPELQSGSKSGRSGSKAGLKSPSADASSPEDLQEDSKEQLPSILDEEEELEDDLTRSSMSQSFKREESDTPALTLDRSPSPVTEASLTITNPVRRPPISRSSSNLATKQTTSPTKPAPGLPQDVKFYLNYFKKHITYHHYAFKTDCDDFLKTAFLDLTIKHEPLRYAVVGFAAYFHTLSKPDGRMSNFLQYYNESVSRLRQSIEKNKKQSLATFLTILQLASIEEVLGDWVNLMGHQKAAHEILTRLYTPESITKTAVLRKVLLWYIRFDMFVGFQSGSGSVLGREWYLALHVWYKEQAEQDPANLNLKYEERLAHARLVAKDSSDLFARMAKGLLTQEAFMAQLSQISGAVLGLEKAIPPVLLDTSECVKDFQGKPDPDDIVNPYEQNVMWGGSRWTTNYLLLDCWAITFMFNIQVSMALRKPFDPDLVKKAYRAAQLFEATRLYPNGPEGAIIEGQASFAIATIFLPKDQKTTQWCRTMFTRVESAGYIYSTTMRNKMLEAWGLEHSDCWLPNDERCPPIIRSIKNFIAERTTAPKDQISDDLREMRGIFSTLTISDSPPSDNTNSTPIESALESGEVPMNLDETLIYTEGSPEFEWSCEPSKYTVTETYGSGHLPGQ